MTSCEKIKLLLSRPSEECEIAWVFTGDSITHGAVHLNDHRDYVQLFEERIRCELSRVHDVVIRTAVGGWNTRHILDNVEKMILRYRPKVLSLMLGMNDSNALSADQFCDNYNMILDKTIEVSDPALILHTTNPVWEQVRNVRINLDECNDIIRSIAHQRGAVLIDNAAIWAKAIERNPRRLEFWMSDPVHPNNYGHIAIVDELFKQLNIFDPEAAMCRLFKP